MKKKILILCISLLLITSCGNVKLINGENAVVTFNENEGISAEELFEVLKDNYGTSMLIDMIDTFLLEKEYNTTSDETNYVNQVISSVKANAKEYEMGYLDYIKNNYGMQNEDDFKNYIKLNYRRTLWIQDYVKEQVTDKQIDDYYEKYTIGDIEARHILITPKTTSNMTAKEKDEAEKKALEEAKDIIKQIKNENDFKELAKEYSEDESNAKDGGYLGFFNRGKMDENFEDATVKLEIGKFTTTPVKSTYGYHIIYKISQKDKPTLKDAKEKIIETIAKETLENDNTMPAKAILALREKYNMNIKDSKLKTGYNKAMNNSSN